MENTPRKSRGGRPRKPAVLRNADGTCSVRTTITIEGESVRRQLRVGTSDKGVARVRGKRLAAGESPELVAKKKETFREAADRLLNASTIATTKVRRSRIERFAYPEIGDMEVTAIKVSHIKDCLERVRAALGWTGTVRHLKNDLSAVLGALFSEGVVSENAALRISFKKKDASLGGERIQRVVLPRIVLTDAEFAALIRYGLEQGDGDLPELYMLALCARCLGGMRTSDLHAWRWEHIDKERWLTAEVPRPKTQGNLDEFGESCLEPYSLEGEAAELVPYLAAWWRRHGCPSMGPVFPVRRGPRAGLHKSKHISYVKQLRKALWSAGVVRPQPGFEQAARAHGPKSEQARKLCALQAGIAKRRAAIDFHSFRRAWVTATSSAKDLSFAESMRLADHRDPATHGRYRRDDTVRHVPAGVLPLALPKLPTHDPEILHDIKRAQKDSNLRPMAPEDEGRASPRKSSGRSRGAVHQDAPQSTTERQNPLPKLDPLRQAVDALLALGKDEMANELIAQSAAAKKSAVVRLHAVRSKRRS